MHHFIVGVLTILLCLTDVGCAQVRQSTDLAKPLPPILHECDVNCNTLRLENDYYVLVTRYRWDTFNGPIIWKVESFTPQSVRLHRTYPVDQVFGGQMSADGQSLINVTLNGRPTSGIHIAWGTALSTVYGSNQERDSAPIQSNDKSPPIMLRINGHPEGSPPCDRDHPPANISADVELQIAEAYGHRKDNVPAACWGELAASQGKVRAQFDTGEAYFKGLGVMPDSAKGILWMTKAADKGNDQDAQIWLVRIYSQGLYGVKPDPVAADYWTKREQTTETQLAATVRGMVNVGVAIMTAPEPCHTVRITNGYGASSEYRTGNCAE